MKTITAIVVLILLFSGCGPEYADDEAQRINTLNEVDNPEIAISLLGSWGYQATVPADIKYAVQLLTAFYYRSRQAGPDADRTIFADGTVIAPAQAPLIVAELIAPYRKLF